MRGRAGLVLKHVIDFKNNVETVHGVGLRDPKNVTWEEKGISVNR
jgi:hypothetical protein